MSQENVELVRAGLAAWAAGDLEGVLAMVDPDCVVDATRNVFNPGTYVGHDGMRKLWAGMDETWAEMRVEPTEFIDAGDRVAVIGRLIGKGRGSGVEVERFNGQVFTVREGRLVRFEFGFTDREALLEAAGPSE